MGRKPKNHNQQSINLNNIETKVYNILKSLKIPFKVHCQVDKYNVDFLIHDKYIIECYGDFWHCNPKKYASDYFNRGKKKTAEEIWSRDKCRKETFEKMGYKFLSLWESELNDPSNAARKKIKRLLEGA
jgi:G:T-mismatch repair DNA endonuclease (very short patch repair protein)